MRNPDNMSSASHEDRLVAFLNKYFHLAEREKHLTLGMPFSLEIEVTDWCNASCIYCYNAAHSGPQHTLLARSVVMPLIAAAASAGVREIWWLGGEPLLHPDLFDFIRHARDSGIPFHSVFTNGLLLRDRARCRQIVQLVDTVIFHLDTVNARDFASLQAAGVDPGRGGPVQSSATHAHMLDGLRSLLDTGYHPHRIRLDVTLCRHSFLALADTLHWAIDAMGFSMATLIPMFSCGRGTSVAADEFLSRDELRDSFHLRAHIERRPELLRLGPSEYCKQYQLTTCYVSANGDVLPYAGIDIICGNVHSQSFGSIISRHRDTLFFTATQRNDRMNNLRGPCGTCDCGRYCFGTRTAAYRNGGVQEWRRH